MAYEAHIQWLLDGELAWNKKRETHDFRPHFSFANFADIFRKAGMLDHNGRVPLHRYNLGDAILRGANLSQVDFIETNLRGAEMHGARFSETDFSQADLTNAKFGSGFLGDAKYSGAILKDTDLVGTNLAGADLGWSRFWQSILYPGSRDEIHTITPADQRISSLSELIDNCFELRKRYKGLAIYFRGERDYTWDLRPSVMRLSKDGKFKLRTHEGQMLRDLISKRPEDFGGMSSALEQMVIAQHHGLKTRLLDVSRNPCVALFSACDRRDPGGAPNDNSMDGRIHIFAVPKELVRTFDSDTVSIISNFAKLDRGYQNLLLGKTGEDSQAEDPEVPIRYLYAEALRLYHFIRQEMTLPRY